MDNFRCNLDVCEKEIIDDSVITLCCDHLACYACVQSYIENTGLTGVYCKKCKKETSLRNIDNQTTFDDLNQIDFDEIIKCLLNQYEVSLKKLLG
jgi:hypothetical protein